MAALLKQFFLLFTNPYCYDEYFLKYNFLHGECFKTSISKALGIAIILGSITVKVPQILKIIKSRSAEGINLLGVLLDLFAMTSSFAYAYVKKFPFSAWGEVLFVAIQTALIAILILHYTKRDVQVGLFVAVYLAAAAMIVTERVSIDLLWSLQVFNLPIVIVGKGLQAVSNFKSKSTGQLSFITCWMQFAGTTVRIFTSIQETGDFMFIVSYIVCSILNGTIAVQCLLYRDSKDKSKKRE